jgi:NADH-quinone oxidoreductase subunit L
MMGPLVVLAVLSLLAGWLATPWWNPYDQFLQASFGYLPRHEHPPAGIAYGLMAAAVALGLVGLYLGWLMIHRKPELSKRFVEKFPGLHDEAVHKFYVEERLHDKVVAGALAVNNLCAQFDNRVVDGAVNLSGSGVEAGANRLGRFDNDWIDAAVNGVADGAMAIGGQVRQAQSGNIRTYITLAILGAVLLIAVFAVTVAVKLAEKGT